MGCRFLLQGIFLTQGSNPGLLHCRQTLYRLSYQESPYKGLECKSRKSRNTWSNRQIWPWNIEWSRAKANRIMLREHTGHSKHPLPTTQEKTVHVYITRWSTLKSDWLYSLQPKMEKLYTVSKKRPGADCGSDHELLIATVLVTQSCPTLQPHGLQPTRLLCPWDFPGKDTGMGCHCLLRWSQHFIVNRWENNRYSDRLYFLGFKNHCKCDCTHEIKRHLLLGRKAMTNLDWRK